MRFNYTICDTPNEEVFYKQCEALEKRINGLSKAKLLRDVDGSLIQIYNYQGLELKVHNCYQVGAVSIVSDFDINPFFPNNS